MFGRVLGDSKMSDANGGLSVARMQRSVIREVSGLQPRIALRFMRATWLTCSVCRLDFAMANLISSDTMSHV